MKQSKILVITICSNQKIQGGDDFKEEAPSILKILPPDQSKELIKRRKAVLDLIQSGSLGRDGIPLNQMQFNSRLACGPEFGGVKTKGTLYMPASDRYAGSFYTAVKAKKDKFFSETPHHILILSALYGILLPEELIQVYSCHIEDHPSLPLIWTEDQFLTSMVLAYIRQFEIDTVFDLTSQDAYRKLLNWGRLSSKTNVLHVFGEQYAGPALLSTLGELAREYILDKTEEEIRLLKPGEKIFLERDKVILTKETFPPDGFPREQKENHFDKNTLPESENQQELIGDFALKPEALFILDHPRDIRVSSKGHNTIFERIVENIDDLPSEIADIITNFSRCPDVLEVFFEERSMAGPSLNKFRFKLLSAQEGTGFVYAKVEGSGPVCHSQDVSIRVTKNREKEAFLVLQKLLDEM